MHAAALVLTALVALEHVWFAVLEMLLWRKPIGLKTFRMSQQKADDSAALAMNQGLYNLFLVAGLIWGMAAEPGLGRPVRIFFLACVVVAGLFGGATVNKRIAFLQAGPAAAALAVTLLAG